MQNRPSRTGIGRLFTPLVLVVCGFLLTSAGAAFAYYSATGSGNASATATSLGTGNQPTATVSGRDVTLTWGAFTNATSYTVTRSNVAPQSLSTTINGTCASSPTGTSCADTGLPENGTASTNWTYTDTPQVLSWSSATSPASAQVTISAPTLSSPVTNVPVSGGTTSAMVANYFDNETVTYCVDDDTTSCPAADQTSPAMATVPASGGTVTTSSLNIPAGLSVGSHTLYAKGSSGSNPTGVSFSVTKVTPTITTAANPASVTVGGSADDQAIVSGGYNPTGTITWSLYSNSSCTGTAVFTTTSGGTVSGNNTYTSGSYPTTSVGTYTWKISYPGDSNNNSVSACGGTGETLTVNKATTSLSTAASTNVSVGQSVTDVATLSDGYNPTGTITYTLYGPSSTQSCTTQVGQVTANVTSGNAQYTSPSITPTQAGTYWWITNYGGDSNNTATTNGCGVSGESSVINLVTPTVASTATPSTATVGGSVADQSVLSGGYNPTGTIAWSLYKGTTCTGTAVFTTGAPAGTVSGNSTYTSASYSVPTANGAGTYTWKMSYTGDTNNNSVTACGGTGQTLTVNLALSPSSLSSATVGTGYTNGGVSISASGGTPSYTYSAAGLPAGVSLSSAGAFSGTPTAGGTFSVVVTAKDSASPQNTGSQTYSLTVNAPTITLSPSTLPNGIVGTTYAGGPVSSSGGTSPYSYAVSSGSLPPGLSLTASGASAGSFTGTPTTAGSYTFTVKATDSSTGTGSPYSETQSYTVVIEHAPSITSANNTTFTASVTGTFTVTATGSPAPTFTEGGNLPSGVTLTTAGVLSGTTTAAGVYPITITASNGVSPNATQSFTLTVNVGTASGSYTYSVPAGYATVNFTSCGGGGGGGATASTNTGGAGGDGECQSGTITVPPTGTTLNVYVGGGGVGTSAISGGGGGGVSGDSWRRKRWYEHRQRHGWWRRWWRWCEHHHAQHHGHRRRSRWWWWRWRWRWQFVQRKRRNRRQRRGREQPEQPHHGRDDGRNRVSGVRQLVTRHWRNRGRWSSQPPLSARVAPRAPTLEAAAPRVQAEPVEATVAARPTGWAAPGVRTRRTAVAVAVVPAAITAAAAVAVAVDARPPAMEVVAAAQAAADRSTTPPDRVPMSRR